MRSCNGAGFPLIGATAAALLALQMPAPATAAGDQPGQAAPKSETVSPGPAAAAVTAPKGQAAEAPVKSAEEGANPAATAEKPKPLPPTLIARINLTTQTMVVQAGSKTLHSWKVSSGAPGYATPPGTFKPGWMAKMWNSRQYDDAPMPHSVFFNGGIAVHGTTSLHNLGRAASHGCVRLSPANAAQFYKLVSNHGLTRTRIVVHGQQPFSAQANRIAKLNQSRQSRPAVRSTASNQWYIAPASAQNGYGAAKTRNHRAGDSYGYRAPAAPRKIASARSQSTYWGGY